MMMSKDLPNSVPHLIKLLLTCCVVLCHHLHENWVKVMKDKTIDTIPKQKEK